MLETQSITIKPEFKVHEVLAICLHFYNKNYYLAQIDSFYNHEKMFNFNHINKIEDSNVSEFTIDHEIYANNNNFEFKFTNTKSYRSNYPSTKIVFTYNDLFLSFLNKFDRVGWENYKLNFSEINTNKSIKRFDDVELINCLKEQNKIVKQVEFMVNNRDFVSRPITDSYNSRSAPTLTFSYIYDFRNYMENIKKYQKKGIFNFDLLSDLLTCIKTDAQDTVEYTLKILKFRKNNHVSFSITLHKKFQLVLFFNQIESDLKEKTVLDSGFNIILPIFEQLGGVDALRMLILQHRILTE